MFPGVGGRLEEQRLDMADEHLHEAKYDYPRAARYEAHHAKSLRSRLTTWRERALLARSLADLGTIDSILDVPCGGGRFFPVLQRATSGELIGADNSDGMLAVAGQSAGAKSGRIRLLKASLFDLDLADNSVDCIVSERFLHHFALAEDRARALGEMRRVARRYVICSLWVDGNLQARRRPPRPLVAGYGPRGWLPRAAVEAEFAAAGLEILHRYDLLPGVSMWRQYALQITAGRHD